MKIESSNMALSSSRSYFEAYTKTETLKMWNEDKEPSSNLKDTILQISDEARQALKESMVSLKTEAISSKNDVSYEASDMETLKLELIEAFFKSLTGKKIKLIRPEKLKLAPKELNIDPSAFNINKLNASQPTTLGWGIIYDSREIYHESEKVSFNAAGTVMTSDGKEIKIDLSVSMSREFMSYNEIHFRAGDAVKIDPLVINFNAPSAALTERKFSFDLDCDGKQDQISFLKQGSGFLSLDLNNDGIINDGRELFGPNSGDGFRDLSPYDNDNNGWIDENDSIYHKLRIWTKDSAGNDILYALGEKGIGAIYLGNALTDFSLKNHSNDLQGEIRKTGVFLRENGSAGTVQHLDLTL